MVSRHWHQLWPHSLHARTEILNTLSRRIQQQLRTLNPDSGDRDLLEQIEQYLSEISRRLQQAGFNAQIGFDALIQQLQHTAISTEARDSTEPHLPTPSAAVTPLLPVPVPSETQPLAVDPQPRSQKHVEPVTVRANIKIFAWRPFSAGMGCMLFIIVLLIGGYQRITTQPEQQAVMATVSPLPVALTREQAITLKQHNPLRAVNGFRPRDNRSAPWGNGLPHGGMIIPVNW